MVDRPLPAADTAPASTDMDEKRPFGYREYKIEDYLVLIVFWLLAAVVFAQFFSRYVLNSSISWTEEIARYLLIFVGFAGSIMGVRKNSHIFVEVFYRFVPARVGRVAARAVDLIKIVFFGVGAWLTWKILPIMANHRMVMVNVPMSWIYTVVFISFLIMTVRSVCIAYRHFKDGFVPFGS